MVFVPGGRTEWIAGWAERKAPKPAVESAKLAPSLRRERQGVLEGPVLRTVPPKPPHEMFAHAWAARSKAANGEGHRRAVVTYIFLPPGAPAPRMVIRQPIT